MNIRICAILTPYSNSIQSIRHIIKSKPYRSSYPKVFLGKGVLKIFVLKICVLKIYVLKSNFIEITLQHGCSSVNLLHVFRTPFLKNTSGQLILVLLLVFTVIPKYKTSRDNNSRPIKNMNAKILAFIIQVKAISFIKFSNWYGFTFNLK